MFLQLFHLSVVVLNIFTITFDQMYVDIPFPSKDLEVLPFKARYLFLTVWCLFLQTLYFAVSFLNDIFGTNEISPKRPPLTRKIKDILFSLAFPVAIFVVTAFWTLIFIDEDLIMPPEIKRAMPIWVNHVMHTAILPFIFIELFATKRNYPSRGLGIAIVISFISPYILLVHIVYFQTGVWVYPFLQVLNWPLKTIFWVLSTCLGLGIYCLGEHINYLVSPTIKSYSNGVSKSMKTH